MTILQRLWYILNWTPPKIYGGLPEVTETLDSVQTSVMTWLGDQIARALSLIGTILLSFPLYFVRSTGFLRIYQTVLIVAFLVLPLLLAWRFLQIAAGSKKCQAIQGGDIIWWALRFVIVLGMAGLVPALFTVIATASNSTVAALLQNVRVNLIYKDLARGIAPDLAVIVLLVVVFVSVVRLIIYYAIRNMHLLWLLLQAPIVLVRWVCATDTSLLPKWMQQLGGLLLIQVLHAFCLVILTEIVSAGPPPDMGAKLGNLWLIIAQIGIMELMLRTQLLLGSIIDLAPVEEIKAVAKATNYLNGRKYRQWLGGIKRRVRNA